MKKLKAKPNSYYLTMGVIVAMSLIFIVIGGLAGWQLQKIFTKESEVVGAATITKLPGDVEEYITSDDESIFFSYVFTDSISFDLTDGIFHKELLANKLEYKPDEFDYKLLVNGKIVTTIKEPGVLSSQATLIFIEPHGESYAATFALELFFYSNRTEVRLSFADKKTGGFLNQMTKDGFNIRMIESPLAPVESENKFDAKPEWNFVIDNKNNYNMTKLSELYDNVYNTNSGGSNQPNISLSSRNGVHINFSSKQHFLTGQKPMFGILVRLVLEVQFGENERKIGFECDFFLSNNTASGGISYSATVSINGQELSLTYYPESQKIASNDPFATYISGSSLYFMTKGQKMTHFQIKQVESLLSN